MTHQNADSNVPGDVAAERRYDARIGSLCSGYGGLEMGLITAVGGTVAWHAELEPAPAKILAHHWPEVPNLGDITAVDWFWVEPVDWLAAGFPCQPASAAGQRKGMDDERWLWDAVAGAISGVRPRRVLLENVPGLLTVDGGRAFERVICDLAALGYVGRYGVIRASDAGAPHARARWFLIAADADSERSDRAGLHAEDQRRELQRRRVDRVLVGAPDTDDRPGGGQRTRAHSQQGSQAAPDTYSDGLTRIGRQLAEQCDADRCDGEDVAWGAYESAIRRWELVTGRTAPRPTEPGRTGERLSPRFVEWLMGLPAGWVTDVPDLTRNQQLKALGNGAVPQQAALAISVLDSLEEVAA